jgi:hypothetical protein
MFARNFGIVRCVTFRAAAQQIILDKGVRVGKICNKDGTLYEAV